MESVISTIKEIKLQELDQDSKLKEKRELESTVALMNKAIREAITQTEKSELLQEKLIKSTDLIRKQVQIEITRREALSALKDTLTIELRELRTKSNENISMVWELRSSFCKEIYSISDACDVWTLLMKPASAEPVFRNKQEKLQTPSSVLENECRLQVASERRAKALAERDRLALEPDNGEEFVRMLRTVLNNAHAELRTLRTMTEWTAQKYGR